MSEYDLGKIGENTSYEPVVRQVENTINNALTIDANNNAVSPGPITLNATVTVSGTWVIV
tara:strand:- start:2338 stop:2517 length:180 start_codon:yes stop_codon:yes gene_type:complete